MEDRDKLTEDYVRMKINDDDIELDGLEFSTEDDEDEQIAGKGLNRELCMVGKFLTDKPLKPAIVIDTLSKL